MFTCSKHAGIAIDLAFRELPPSGQLHFFVVPGQDLYVDISTGGRTSLTSTMATITNGQQHLAAHGLRTLEFFSAWVHTPEYGGGHRIDWLAAESV